MIIPQEWVNVVVIVFLTKKYINAAIKKAFKDLGLE